MTPASNRRDFLRTLGLRAALEGAGPQRREAEATPSEPAPAADALVEPPAPARCADLDDLRALVEEEGLSQRSEQILGLVRRSIRMTPDTDADTARAWVDFAAGAALAAEDAEGTVLLAQIATSAPELAGTALAGTGWCVLFCEPTEGAGLAVQVTRLDDPAVASPTMQPVALAPHLTLPRVWNQAVQTLGLDQREHASYVRLRERVAAGQGVEAEPGGAEEKAYHRLFGYPDESTGAMPDACIAAAGDGDWRLFAQFSLRPGRRIYLWAADESLERTVGFIR